MCACCVIAASCGGDGARQADAAAGADGLPDAAGAQPADAAAGADSAGPPDAPGGATPIIERVEWVPAAGCRRGVRGRYTITVTATDADTPAAALTYGGSVSSCFPAITRNPAEITCPNVQPYPGVVTVTDPEGHRASRSFTIEPCRAGSEPP